MENDCEKYGLAPFVCGIPIFLVLGTLPGNKNWGMYENTEII